MVNLTRDRLKFARVGSPRKAITFNTHSTMHTSPADIVYWRGLNNSVSLNRGLVTLFWDILSSLVIPLVLCSGTFDTWCASSIFVETTTSFGTGMKFSDSPKATVDEEKDAQSPHGPFRQGARLLVTNPPEKCVMYASVLASAILPHNLKKQNALFTL